MSLTINVATPEGLVFAADSRQSYRNRKGQSRVGSDSAIKIIQLNDRTAVTMAGPAFLPENDTLKNVSKFVDDFRQKNDRSLTSVKTITEHLKEFFEEKYPYREQLKKLPDQIKANLQVQGLELLEVEDKGDHIEFSFRDKKGNIKKGSAGVDPLSLMVGGYDPDGSHHVYIAYIPGSIQEKRNSNIKKKEYGASWTGQIDVITRVVLGRDPRTVDLLIQNSITRPELTGDQITHILGGLEYAISWGTMTLQDAIDFCTLIIQTTSAIQRFSDGIVMDPGDIPGVGGSIDVAVITPKKGFIWVSKKNLKVGEKEVNLDDFEDLSEQEEAKRKVETSIETQSKGNDRKRR